MATTVLIIDDEELVRESLQGVLEDEGYNALAAESYKEAKSYLATNVVDIVLLDVWLENEDGLELLPKVISSPSKPDVIMISGHASIDHAVKATKFGAYDFLEKPISIDRLFITVSHVLQARKLKKENSSLRQKRIRSHLVGRSNEILELHQMVMAAGKSISSVMIFGENGAGKEVVARLLHENSPRAEKTFVAVNCAAIPETLIESELFGYEKGAFTGATQTHMGRIEGAGKGTLFLDEVGDLSLSAQAKLLRVIQEKSISRLGSRKEIAVDVRWVAATNKNLEALVKEGKFREDLLYRLNVIRIDVKPLRAHRDDIAPLAEHFLKHACIETGSSFRTLSPQALKKLMNYEWPGNIRELKNVMERAVVMGNQELIQDDDITFHSSMAVERFESPLDTLLEIKSFKGARKEFEKEFLKRQLVENGNNVSRLATKIGLERTYLYRKLKQYDLVGDSV